jgi:hypothetical protein
MISTTANTLVPPARRLLPPSDWTNLQRFLVFGLLALSIVMFRAHRQRVRWVVSTCLLLVVLTSLAGCTNGSSNSMTTFPGTPPGTYAVTVSGDGAGGVVNAPGTLTLTVTTP